MIFPFKKVQALILKLFLIIFFSTITILITYFELNGKFSLSDILSMLGVLGFTVGLAFHPEILFHPIVLKDKKILSTVFSLKEKDKKSTSIKPIYLGLVAFFLFSFLSMLTKLLDNSLPF